jgi:hypothetical protein
MIAPPGARFVAGVILSHKRTTRSHARRGRRLVSAAFDCKINRGSISAGSIPAAARAASARALASAREGRPPRAAVSRFFALVTLNLSLVSTVS